MGIVQLTLFDSKVCRKCGEKKLQGDFYRDSKSRDGLRPWCKTCWRAYQVENVDRLNAQKYEYARRHPDKVKATRRKTYAKNPETYRAHARKWGAKNPERRREKLREWRQRNPERHCLLEQVRRTRKNGAGGKYTIEEWKALCAQYDNRCLACGKRRKLSADHIIPVSKGGSSDISNIQPLCKTCNSKKHNKTADYRPRYE